LKARGEPALARLKIHADLEVVFGDEGADRALPLDEEREGRRLHAADAEPLIVAEAIKPREVHADEPIGAAPSIGGVVEPVIIAERLERLEAAHDRLVGERADKEAREPDATLHANLSDKIAKDELALSS